MTRIFEISSREDLPQDKRHIFDAIAETRGRVAGGGPFGLLLNSPEVAGRTAHLGTYIRFESVLSRVASELAILTTARECDCEFEWAAHVRLAQQAGAREEAIDVIGHRHPLDRLTQEEAMIVAYGRELLGDHKVSNATFEAVRARYGDQGVTDLTATMGYYAMIACTLNSFELEPLPGAPRLP
jgi:4-carboxymuconolactone decarboxylase